MPEVNMTDLHEALTVADHDHDEPTLQDQIHDLVQSGASEPQMKESIGGMLQDASAGERQDVFNGLAASLSTPELSRVRDSLEPGHAQELDQSVRTFAPGSVADDYASRYPDNSAQRPSGGSGRSGPGPIRTARTQASRIGRSLAGGLGRIVRPGTSRAENSKRSTASGARVESTAAQDKQRVFVYVPFTRERTSLGFTARGDRNDPNESAENWVKVRNASNTRQSLAEHSHTTGKNERKEYVHLAGPEEFNSTQFQDGDRIYVHAHGGNYSQQIYGKSAGRDDEDQLLLDKHTPETLWQTMSQNDSFKALNNVDLRIAACHTNENFVKTDAGGTRPEASFTNRLAEAARQDGRTVNVKGKTGEMSGNIGSMSRFGGRVTIGPDRKDLQPPSPPPEMMDED